MQGLRSAERRPVQEEVIGLNEALKVIELPDRMHSANEAIEAAVAQKPRVVIVIGINENGEEFDHCSHADLPTLLWLLERAKARLIAV